jgi:hypothetical protein
MRVKTTEKCYFNDRIYEVGEIFDLGKQPMQPFMVEVDQDGNPVEHQDAKRTRKAKSEDTPAVNA